MLDYELPVLFVSPGLGQVAALQLVQPGGGAFTGGQAYPYSFIAISSSCRRVDARRAERAGLKLWQGERHAWQWQWSATDFRSERGFWASGEAIVDAVVSRYPAAFDGSALVEMQ
jgi:hypothetical protein